MSDEKEKHASNINVSISELLNSETVLKRKKKTEEDRRKEMFESIVTALEKTNIRSELSVLDLNLDLKIIQAELLYKFYDEQIKFFVEPSGIIKKNFEIDDNKNNLFFTISFLFVALQMAFFYLKKKKLNLLKNFFK